MRIRRKSDNSVALVYHLTGMHCAYIRSVICFHHPKGIGHFRKDDEYDGMDQMESD